jgi:hypothetical protein
MDDVLYYYCIVLPFVHYLANTDYVLNRYTSVIPSRFYRSHPVVYVITVNTTNKVGISSMRTTEVGKYLTHFM